ncbi:P-loop containing nucleoside triphosphate hydrolase protein [Syncephalis fuscata]|nr:P-loop containing nucleoside triphosphate hydrolase protein [Syncephalis fuscata]
MDLNSAVAYFLASKLLAFALIINGRLERRGSLSRVANGRLVSLEESASWIDKFSFNWLTPLMAAGYEHRLNVEDLWAMIESDRAAFVSKNYAKYEHKSIMVGIFYACWPSIIQMAIYGSLWGITIDPTSDTPLMAWIYHCMHQGMFAGWRSEVQIQAMLSSRVFNKCLVRQNIASVKQQQQSRPSTDATAETTNEQFNNTKDDETDTATDWNTGTIANILNVDVSNIAIAFSLLSLFIGSAIQVFVAVFFMWQLVGWATIIGLVVLAPLYWISSLVSNWLKNTLNKYLHSSDVRLGIVNEMLQSIRMIKLFAWEPQFQQRIKKARDSELDLLRDRLLLLSIFTVITHGNPAIMLCATLGAYTLILGHTLTAATVFTAVAVFNTLRSAVEQLPELLFWLCTNSSLLDLPDVQRISDDNIDETMELPERIAFIDASFSWGLPNVSDTIQETEQDHSSAFELRRLNIEFSMGQLNLIVGPTGSGKTSMLLALLGEMTCTRGSALLPTYKRLPNGQAIGGQVAYVAQQAWLQSLSIRDNILFGQKYEEDRYNQVVFACALERDLEILDAGDSTEIGEKGVTLSGGQKQRVALARALYSSAKHILLDDCLSAVDAHTAKHIVKHCLQGPLMQGRTRILVTHHVELCAHSAAFTVVLEKGAIIAQGTTADVLDIAVKIDKNAVIELSKETEADADNIDDKETDGSEKKVNLLTGQPDKVHGGRLVEEEAREQGGVKMGVYSKYIKAGGGYLHWLGIILVITLMQLILAFHVYWLRIWTNNTQDSTHLGYYFGIYTLLSLLVLVAIGIRHAIPLLASQRASRVIHAQFVDKLAHANVRFFDKTPIGRILNRFSKDISNIDKNIPISLGFLVVNSTEVIFIIVIISTVAPKFLICCIIIGLCFMIIGAYCIRSSCELKRLESISKSPFLSLVTETLTGVTTIRAFSANRRFIKDCHIKIDTMNCPSYLLSATNQWMAYRSDCLSALITTLCCAFLLLNHESLDAGFIGFTLTYALLFSEASVWIVRNANYIELAMNGMERIMEYINVEQEKPAIIKHHRPDRSGQLMEKLSPVIRDLSFNLKAGERVGIVGRTGAGKSSLTLAFFRFIEASSGRILVDNVDISQIGLHDLRSRLTIIPQDPILFSGTVRSNLDPFSMHDDASIWNALRRSHLIDDQHGHSVRPVGLEHLDAPVTENGGNFSQGQRQLLAMARALLRDSRVIIMDEATASVDFETDARIQQTVREEFTHATLICIAHRLRTIIDYDRVLVLDAGRLVEFDTPTNLLNQPNSIFRELCEHSGELDMLLSMVKSTASTSTSQST